jgi:hypothetical protein
VAESLFFIGSCISAACAAGDVVNIKAAVASARKKLVIGVTFAKVLSCKW